MAKAIPIIGIIGAVLAALTATIFVDIMPAVVALLALGAGIFLAISKDWRRLAPGIGAAIFAILGILGTIGNVGGEDGSLEFGISTALGTAFVVAACLELAGASALLLIDQDPKWVPYAAIGGAALAFILAIAMQDQLGDQSQAGSFVVAVVALVTLVAPIQLLRSGA